MPDPKDHLDPKEATEAKLCAYLEGELAPIEHAEIEQHLAVNPQHRQLLADLARTRDWVRSIPAESSPVDLAELFQGQAERSMLLDEPSGSSRMMIRMPQFVMVAAIAVLTVGLGVLVVVMLKGPKPGENKGFSLGPTAPAVSPATAPVDQARELEQDKFAKAKNTEVNIPVAAATPVTTAPGAVAASVDTESHGGFGGGGGGGGGRGGGVLAQKDSSVAADEARQLAAGARRDRSVGNDFDADTVRSKLVQSGYHLPLGQKTVCFVISADSPQTTDEQVRGFFSRHQLAFDDAITGMHESPGTPYAMAMGKLDDLKASGAKLDTLNRASTQSLANNSVNGNVTIGNAQTTPNEQSQGQADNGFQNGGQAANNHSQSLYSTRAAIPVMAPTTAPAGESIYVSYGLTPLQFNLLSASLSTDNLSQAVKQLTLSEGLIAQKSTTAPAGAVAKGQTLTVSVAQLVGPGIEKTNVVKVAEDGTIALPMIDPLPAAGAQPAELERKIADKYREANLIPQATVTVTAAAASTQPLVASTQPATMPSSQPAVADTTPPAVAKPVEDGVDVVVVIQKSASILPPK